MPTSSRPRVAVIATAYYKNSHADVIVSRWVKPLPTDAKFGWPANGADQTRTEIVSIHIVQTLANDIGVGIMQEAGVPLFPTVRDALTLGGDVLAVDAVLLIGEHGEYPYNRWGQKMYPRRELFDEIVAVFRESGRSVPVFNDKYFSYDVESARRMVRTSRELGFPLMGGSSIPLGKPGEDCTIPDGAKLTEAVALYYHLPEIYGYHSIEFLQSIVEKRAGGESGVEAVTSYYDDSFWEADKQGVWSQEMVQEALKRASNVAEGDYHNNCRGVVNQKVWPHKWPVAFVFHHKDGLQTAHLQLHEHVTDWSVAVRAEDGQIYSRNSSGKEGEVGEFFPHCAVFDSHIEEFLLTGKSPYSLEHTLRCTLLVAEGIHALDTPGKRVAIQDF
jgi:hypothetical protein